MEKIQEKINAIQIYFNEHGFLSKIVVALLILIIGWIIIGLLSKILKRVLDKRSFDETLKPFAVSLFSWTFRALLFVIAAAVVGIETTSFIALLGAVGFAIGMGFQGALANLAGGALILVFRPYKIGDMIETQGHFGTVKEIQIFNTILTSPESKTIILPNGATANSDIVNYTVNGFIRVDMTVGISYNADIDTAKKALMDVLIEHKDILEEPAPFVGVLELGDSSVNLAVRPFCAPEKYWDVYFDIYEASKKALDNASVEIPFPQMDVHISK